VLNLEAIRDDITKMIGLKFYIPLDTKQVI